MTYVMKDIGVPISDADITKLQSKLKLHLPEEYKSFLKKFNGGRPVPKFFQIGPKTDNTTGQVLDFFGIDDPIESCRLDWNYEVFSERMPNEFFPIACEDGGNVICLCLSTENFGSVYYWDHGGETTPPTFSNVYKLALTLNQFLDELFSNGDA